MPTLPSATPEPDSGNTDEGRMTCPISPRALVFTLPGTLHPSVRVPSRDISLKDNSSMRVYDTRGPWGDPEATCDVHMGLSPLRESWILERGDTEEYAGRNVKPEDNGFLSDKHADQSSGKNRLESFPEFAGGRDAPSNGGAATQLHYARKGIITPEMEFVAIRENLGREQRSNLEQPDRPPIPARGGVVRRQDSRHTSPRNSFATKSPADAPSFPPISIISNWSR